MRLAVLVLLFLACDAQSSTNAPHCEHRTPAREFYVDCMRHGGEQNRCAYNTYCVFGCFP